MKDSEPVSSPSPFRFVFPTMAFLVALVPLGALLLDMATRQTQGHNELEEAQALRIKERVAGDLLQRERTVAELAAWMAQELPLTKMEPNDPRLYDLLYERFAKELKGTEGLIYFGNDQGGILVAGRAPAIPNGDPNQWRYFCDLAYLRDDKNQLKVVAGDYAEFFVPEGLKSTAVTSFNTLLPDPLRAGSKSGLEMHFLCNQDGVHVAKESTPRRDLLTTQLGSLQKRLERNWEIMVKDGKAYNACARPWYIHAPESSQEQPRSYGVYTYYNGLASGVSALRKVSIALGGKSGKKLEGVVAVDCSDTYLKATLYNTLETIKSIEIAPLGAFLIAPATEEEAEKTDADKAVITAETDSAQSIGLNNDALEKAVRESIKKSGTKWRTSKWLNVEFTGVGPAGSNVPVRLLLKDLPEELHELPWKVGLIIAKTPEVAAKIDRAPFAWFQGRYGLPAIILPVAAMLAVMYLAVRVIYIPDKERMKDLVHRHEMAKAEIIHADQLRDLSEELENSRKALDNYKLRIPKLHDRQLSEIIAFHRHELLKHLHDPDQAAEFVEGETALAIAIYVGSHEHCQTLVTVTTDDIVRGIKGLDAAPQLAVKTCMHVRHSAWRITCELVENARKYSDKSPGGMALPNCRLSVLHWKPSAVMQAEVTSIQSSVPTVVKPRRKGPWAALRSWFGGSRPEPEAQVQPVPVKKAGYGIHDQLKAGIYLRIAVKNLSKKLRALDARGREELFESPAISEERTLEALKSEQKGTGLGLHSARRLARALKGDLLLQDGEEPDSVVFILMLPIIEDEVKATSTGRKVLVLDDDEQLRGSVAAQLPDAVFCTSPGQFFAAVSAETEIMLLDQHLGHGLPTGLEIARQLRGKGYAGLILLHTSESGLRGASELAELQVYYVPKGEPSQLGVLVHDRIKDWCEDRTYPAHAEDMRAFLEQAGARRLLRPLNFQQLAQLAAEHIRDPLLRNELCELARFRKSKELRDLFRPYRGESADLI